MSSPGAAENRLMLSWVWIAYWAALFVATHIPKFGVPMAPKGSDKLMHFLGYFLLTLLAGRTAIRRGVAISRGWLARWTVIFLTYGALDEFLQQFVSRHASVYDWIADAVGVVAGMGILCAVRERPSEGLISEDQPGPMDV